MRNQYYPIAVQVRDLFARLGECREYLEVHESYGRRLGMLKDNT